jgi:hypothetical protein
MPAHQEQDLLNQFTLCFSSPYAHIYQGGDSKSLICQLQLSYIAIEDFKQLFARCSALLQEQPAERFIFDKRSLRAFHQPSMEWYFVHWKQEVYRNSGLRVHRKILPYAAWFKTCVEAGRHEIAKKYPDTRFDMLDIQYASSIAEALRI